MLLTLLLLLLSTGFGSLGHLLAGRINLSFEQAASEEGHRSGPGHPCFARAGHTRAPLFRAGRTTTYLGGQGQGWGSLSFISSAFSVQSNA